MTGATLLAALPCAALGLSLGRVQWRIAVIVAMACALSALLANLFLGSILSSKTLVVACGITAVVTVVPVYLPRTVRPFLLLAIAINAGVWSGAFAAGPNGVFGLATALSWIALGFPAAFLVRRNWQIALKVVASWMLAIALLAVTLNTVSMPSYELDHME